MSKVFGDAYSNLYDIFYQDKNYENECNIIEKIFRKYQKAKINKTLDLGCGTGNYTIPLCKRGYKMTGVDLSEYMLKCAREKTLKVKKDITFIQGDIRTIKLNKRFDAVIMMFAVLGYQIENDEVISALKNVRSHLDDGGLFIFDVWFGPAVLHNKPSLRVKTIKNPDGGKIIRIASGDLDLLKHKCLVNYQILKIGKDLHFEEFDEHHSMRYFFPQELQLLLKISGFELLMVGAYPEYDRKPDENDWNIVIAAKAV